MKGIIHINLAKTWRGGERQVALLMENLRLLGINQILICIKSSAIHQYCMKNSLPHRCYSSGTVFLFAPFQLFLLGINKTYGIVHCHESRAVTIAFLARFLFKCKLKTVIHRRVLFPIRQKKITLLKYSPKYADVIICISKAVENVVKEIIADCKTVVIPSGVTYSKSANSTANFRTRLKIDKDKKLVVYIGALSFEKDHFTFLNSAKHILGRYDNVHFAIIGEGELFRQLVEYSKKLGISQQVTFTGFQENIDAIIPETDILLFTSNSEGLGSIILDYFFQKRPVVSAKNGGAEELIIDNETGLLCDIGDAESFATKTVRLLCDEAERNRITSNAFNFALNNFTDEKIAQRTLNLYKFLLDT
jgi:glycosyltransferase involved in cell wall biosynthesis